MLLSRHAEHLHDDDDRHWGRRRQQPELRQQLFGKQQRRWRRQVQSPHRRLLLPVEVQQVFREPQRHHAPCGRAPGAVANDAPRLPQQEQAATATEAAETASALHGGQGRRWQRQQEEWRRRRQLCGLVCVNCSKPKAAIGHEEVALVASSSTGPGLLLPLVIASVDFSAELPSKARRCECETAAIVLPPNYISPRGGGFIIVCGSVASTIKGTFFWHGA